jgi:hypothetical protein
MADFNDRQKGPANRAQTAFSASEQRDKLIRQELEKQRIATDAKTAFVTMGGSYTVIPYVAQVAVLKLHWLTRLQMMDGFALAETTPGPLIIVVAFVGFLAG